MLCRQFVFFSRIKRLLTAASASPVPEQPKGGPRSQTHKAPNSTAISVLKGTIGGLAMAGTESIPRTTDTVNKTYFFWGIGTGWLSPSILNTVKLSFSTLSVCHIQFETWWDNSAKAGILFNINKDHLIGSIEYGFGLNGTSAPEYEVFKGDFSLRFMSITGLLFGFSTDTRNIRNNGSTFHTGIELRRSYVYPFFGGYEIGFNMFASRYNPNSLPDPSPHLSLIHRFWLGYDLRNNRP
jgi:hypothetical protein